MKAIDAQIDSVFKNNKFCDNNNIENILSNKQIKTKTTFDTTNLGDFLTDSKHANLFTLISQELLKNQVLKI